MPSYAVFVATGPPSPKEEGRRKLVAPLLSPEDQNETDLHRRHRKLVAVIVCWNTQPPKAQENMKSSPESVRRRSDAVGSPRRRRSEAISRALSSQI